MTWKLSIILSGALVGFGALTLLLPERVGTPAFWVLLLGGMIVVARTAENDLRHRAQGEPASNRPWSPGRGLLYPWWARVITVATAASGAAAVAEATSGEWLLWFLGAMLIGVLVEWLVIGIRARRGRLS